jgi:hypothetical protein
MTTDSKREAKACDTLAAMMGYAVVNLEQQRATRLHVGLPDRRYQGKHAFFFELKLGRDKLAVEQHRFLRAELDAGGIASCGGMVELTALLGALQRPSLVHARNLCADQIDQWVKRGFRGQRTTIQPKKVAA